jgi:glycosyltransferase involved in cell wall biosynthesis
MASNVVLSYGDLSRQTGYRTRVLGELEHLDQKAGLAPTLLLFDREPEVFEKGFDLDIPYRAHSRSSMIRFYPEMARLARQAPVKMVHAHNLYSAALALSARRLYGYKVVLDYHGRIPEEYVYLGKGGNASRKSLEQLERWTVRSSDHIIVVSEMLGEYLQDRYAAPRSKISVIPCCADAGAFQWNLERRENTRRELGLNEKIVCTHLGSFFEWYEPELLVRLFRQLLTRSTNAHLLVMTREAEDARSWLRERLKHDTFTVISVDHERVPLMLNASDLGFLLLRPSPNIRTSSPAKFSEYLNCGLPVAITPDVGDFSALIEKTGAGVVASGAGIDMAHIDRMMTARYEYAARCVDAGRSLSWQSYESSWRETVKSLTEGP